jgi:hypothetical protein
MARKPVSIEPVGPVSAVPDLPATIDGGGAVGLLVDRAARLQAPAVAKYVTKLRAAHPDDSPAQLVNRLEKRYLTAVTGSGGAAGATAAVPAVGTVMAMSTVAGETVFFMECSALYALALAEVHGIPIEDRELRRTLVLTAVLGEAGLSALRTTVGAKNANLMALKKGPLPLPAMGSLNKQLMKLFTKKFLKQRAPLMLGTLLPAGIGMVVGAGGNRVLGKAVVRNAHQAFGPAPVRWDRRFAVIEGGSATAVEPDSGPSAPPSIRG